MELRVCSTCKVDQAIDNYFKKRNSYEAICKTCKRTKRRARETSVKALVVPVGGMIDLCSQKKEFVSTSNVIQSLDMITDNAQIEPESFDEMAFWERKYGRNLSDSDKIEIRSNLFGLFELLKVEFSKKKTG